MELIQIPTHYRDKTGNEVPITAPPDKLVIHHLGCMTEGDWNLKWSPPSRKKSIRVNLAQLDDPLLRDMFDNYKYEVSNHKELGTPIISPNPKDTIAGYIYNCYSYPADPVAQDQILVPPGFIVEQPEALARRKLQRIERKIQERADENKTIEKDDMFQQYQNHLLSQGLDPDSREYTEKSIAYWTELGVGHKAGLEGCVPSRSPEIILTTGFRKYNQKALRARFRYIQKSDPEFYVAYQMTNPSVDLSTYPGKMSFVEEYDNAKMRLVEEDGDGR